MGVGLNTPANNNVFLLPSAGDYTIRVTDVATGCYFDKIYKVLPFAVPTVTALAGPAIKCFGDTTSLSINVANYTGTYSYEVFQQGTPNIPVYTNSGDTTISNPLLIPNPFGAGVYFVVLKQTGVTTCTLTSITQTIVAPANVVAVTVKSNVNANCKVLTSTVTLEGSGGTPFATGYTYAVVTQGAPAPTVYSTTATATFTASLDLTTSANWTAYVKDANDCINQVNIIIATDPNPTINIVAPLGNQCDLTAATYPINVTATGLSTVTSPLQYSINEGAGPSAYTSTTNYNVSYPPVGFTKVVTVTVIDLNGCTATTTPAITIYPKLDINIVNIKQPTCLNAANNDGIVTFLSTGGNSGLTNTYTISPSVGTAFVAPDKFTGLTANIEYTITVTNGIAGCTDFVKVTPIKPTDPSLLPSTKVDVKCFGGNTGSFVINLATPTTTVNNDPLYTYVIFSQPVGATPTVVQNTFSNLIAGTYEVDVFSNSQCKVTQTVTIEEPTFALVVPQPLLTQSACPANSNVTSFPEIVSPLTGANAVSGGIAPYMYQFSLTATGVIKQFFSSVNSYTVTDPILVPTDFTLTVKDANGCTTVSTLPVTVNPFTKLVSLNVNTTQLIDCRPGTTQNIIVTATIDPTAPVVPLIYTVTGLLPSTYVSSNANGVFSGLNVPPNGLLEGTYTISVTNPATGCVYFGDNYFVNNANKFQINVSSLKDATCYGVSNGSVDITVVDNIKPPDDAGAFTLTLTSNTNPSFVYSGLTSSPSAGPFTLTNLPAGRYTVTTTLVASGCSTAVDFTITEPREIKIEAKLKEGISCTNAASGEIEVLVTDGGIAPYFVNVTRTLPLLPAVSYSNLAPGIITGLVAGTYQVTVIDSSIQTPTSCSKTTTVIVPDQPNISSAGISSNLIMNRLLCFGDKNAIITVSNVIGGDSSSYTYTLNNITLGTNDGPYSTNIFSGLGEGTYSVTINDKLGCSFTTQEIKIEQPNKLVPTLSNPNPIDCSGFVEIVLTAIGGTPPYTYSTSATGPFGGSFVLSTPPILVTTGKYKYFVKDANNCSVIGSNEISIPTAPKLTLLPLISGRVGCSDTIFNTGTITAEAQGGYDTNYTYNLSTSNTGVPIIQTIVSTSKAIFTNLIAGDYYVNVTTAGNCNSGFNLIKVLPQLKLDASIVSKDITCKGQKDGMLTISITNPTGIVQYLLSPVTGLYTDLKPKVLSVGYDPILNLPTGSYTLLVYDQDVEKCSYRTTFEIKEPSLLENNLTTDIIQAPCSGNSPYNTGGFTINMKPGSGTTVTSTNNGGIIGDGYDLVSVDGRTLPTTYFTLNQTDLNTFVIGGLSGGPHKVIMKDLNGCLLPINVTLDPSVDLKESAKVDYFCPNPQNNTNTITVSVNPLLTATGSDYKVSYSLDGATPQSSPIFNNVSPGLHSIKVISEISFTSPTRTNTCEKTISNIKVLFIDPLALTLTAGNQNEIIAIATGGTTPYNFNFNGIDTGTTPSYIIDKTDNYFVTVKDNRGCSLTVSKTFSFIDIFIPNFFSPDGDGNNDGWAPQNTFNFKNLVFYVFDRYGRKIGTFNEGQFWDGKYQGTELPTGDYWYLIKPEGTSDSKEYVGNFSLYR